MSPACAAPTDIHEARPQLLVRTTQFLKKVSNFRTISRKNDSRLLGQTAYQRSAQSMDLGSMALTKVEVRAHHQSFEQSRDSGEDSPSHLSLRALAQPPRLSAITGDSPRPIEGLPRTTNPFRATPTAANAAAPATPATVQTRAQTLPSRHPAVSNGNTLQTSTVGVSTRRALVPRLATLPPPLMAQYTAAGSARLTSSLVTRQPPMPILNLPTLPPPTPPQPAQLPRPRTAPLRSLPALPMRGPSDTDHEADHENASLDEEDEDEDGEGGGDGDENSENVGHDTESDDSSNEDEDAITPPQSSSSGAVAGPSRLPSLPPVDTSEFNLSALGLGISGAPLQRTPRAPAQANTLVDYFTSKTPDLAPTPDRTPRLSDFRPNANGKVRAPLIAERVPQPRVVPMPATPEGSPRPGLYHQASKSMVDLASMTRKDKDKVISPKLGRTPPPPKAPTAFSPLSKQVALPADASDEEQPRDALLGEELPDDVITSSILRRRRSLPVYEPSSDPPPYPDPVFRRRTQVQLPSYPYPPEEEGREKLPEYSNAIFLAGVMPRKLEFSAPGMQARDRKWRRVYCVLEGTAFRVYKCPPAASRVGALEQWWESKVGAGDTTSIEVTAVTASGVRVSAVRERPREPEAERERIPKIVEEAAIPAAVEDPSSNSRDRTLGTEQAGPLRSREPSNKSRLGITSRFLRRQRSKSIGRSSTQSNSSSSRLSMDSRQQDSPRQASPTVTRHSIDTLGSIRPSIASTGGTQVTTSTTLTVPSPTSSSSSPSSSDSPSRFSRARFLSHSSSNSLSNQGQTSPEKDTAKSKGKEKDKDSCYTPDSKDLICQYSLQHAESGLASDYQKRKNVIRMRMGGEQFLLQAKDVAAVIDWIEGIQKGTNVALDLDERPMPKGPIFPRRRRRRVRRVVPAGETTSTETTH